MRRLAFGVLAIIVLAAVSGYVFRGPIALALMQRTLGRNVAANPIADLPDGLHIGLCSAARRPWPVFAEPFNYPQFLYSLLLLAQCR